MFLRFHSALATISALAAILSSALLVACSSAPAELPASPMPTSPAAAESAESAQPERFAAGATIAGVDVSGLDAAAATARLHDELDALVQPVQVRAAEASLKLEPAAMALQLDIPAL
ncbi:MAG: hypothetical protein HC828_16940 [Blastochloris sp.]|nr:hypothetical protein [Blastochloris sp.]